jgi:hypothetical protein
MESTLAMPVRALLFGLAISVFPSLTLAQLSSDKTVATVGEWSISTARYGVGCVARFVYSKDGYDGYEISISGEQLGQLTLLVTVDPKQFATKLNGSEQDISHIEVALADNRWNVEAYGFRGTPGVVLNIDTAFLNSFSLSKAIKITERGYEKLRIELNEPKAVLAKLAECFKRDTDTPPSNVSRQKPPSSQESYVGRWYSDNVTECRARQDDLDETVTYTKDKMFGMENSCRILKKTPKGDGLELTMRCTGEGMTSTDRETLRVVNGKLRVTRIINGKPITDAYSRCP